MIYGHLNHRKGRGGWVVLMPVIVACVLFIIFDVAGLDNKFVRDISLILSGILLLLIDEKRAIITEGVTQKLGERPKGLHLFMGIEMRYWAMLLCVIGIPLFIADLLSL